MEILTPKKLFNTRAIIFFSMLILLKSYLSWFVIFDDGPSWTTMLKELPFVLIVFCLIEWFAKKRKLAMYLLANLVLTTIFFAVIMYYKYYGVIVTYHALDQVNQVTAVKNSVFSLMDPYYLFIFSDIIVIAALLFRRNAALNWKRNVQRSFGKRVTAVLFCVSIIMCVLNILPHRLSMSEIVKAEKMGILNYEAYTLLAK